MSTENQSTPQGKLEIPRLQGEALQFVQTILAIGMPYDYAVKAFLDSFPAYAEHETLTDAEIHQILRKRFKHMRGNTQRSSYHKIKETETSLKQLLDCIPVASPLIRLIELEKKRQDSDLECGDLIKVLNAAAKEVERLMPRERTSPFAAGYGMGLPDLTPTDGKESPPDPFGGAIMEAGRNRNADSSK